MKKRRAGQNSTAWRLGTVPCGKSKAGAATGVKGVSVCQWHTSREPTEPVGETMAPCRVWG